MTEDVGTTPRKQLSTRDRLRIWERCKGICICGRKVQTGEKWQADHPTALALGGEDNPDIMVVLGPCCVPVKNADDMHRIAKAKRMKARHIGAKVTKYHWPCGKRSPFRKKVNGQVVRRDEE